MTGIYKKFKSGTDIRGIGIGNGDEPLYMSDEFISKASAVFADFLSEKTGKAADKLTVAIGPASFGRAYKRGGRQGTRSTRGQYN